MQRNPSAFLTSTENLQYSAIQDFQTLMLRAKAYKAQGNNEQAIIELKTGIAASYTDALTSASVIRAILYEYLSELQLEQGKLQDARESITQAIEKSNNNASLKELITRLIKRAQIDSQLDADMSALQDLQLAFKLAYTLEDKPLLAEIAVFIMTIHQKRNEHNIAVSYATQAIEILRKVGTQKLYAETLLQAAESLIALDQLELAIGNLNDLAHIERELDDKNLIALASYLKAKIELQLGNPEQSIVLVNQALNLFSGSHYKEIASAHLLLSRAYTQMNDIDAAIENLIVAFNLVKQQPDVFKLLQNLHLQRAELLARLNQPEEAFNVMKNLVKVGQLNRPIGEIQGMLDMHANFQLQMQQQENAELKLLNQTQLNELENRKMLSRLYYVIIILLCVASILLFLLFVRTRHHRQKLEQIAHVDHLTGVFSRRRIFEVLEYQQDMFARNKQAYSLAIVDLDHFKKINDEYGHQMGDEVLKAFAQLAKESFRKTDSIGRIGGEEFLFIFPETPMEQGERLLNLFSEEVKNISSNLKLKEAVTISAGIVQPQNDEIPSDAVRRADKALYQAKNNGRDQIVSN